MGRRTHAVALALVAVTFAAPAAAQFGGLFGAPPRPPASVPGPGTYDYPPPNYPAPPPRRYENPPPRGYENPPPPQDGYGYPPAPQDPYESQNGRRPGGAYGNIQSQPLPPPPGAGQPAPDAQPREPAVTTLPPGQRQPRGGPQPADTSPQPGDEVVVEPPTEKIVNKGAVFSGLDKITGRIIKFDVAIGETVQFGALQLTPRACYTRPPTEPANTDAFVEVDEVTLKGEIKRIFTGWMFASSPGLHAVEHPIYDVWLTDCKGPVVAADQSAEKTDTKSPPSAPARIPRRATPRRSNAQ
jgi:hypothetical protein